MSRLRVFLARCLGMFSTRRADRDLDDELAFHIEKETEQQIRQGLTPREARRAALRRFGGVQQTKEAYRRVRAVTVVETCFLEIRYALRTLGRNPAYTVVAVLTLAIGIGGVAAIFSMVNGVLLRPLPYRDPERLVEVYAGPTRIPPEADWPSRQRVFDEILQYRTRLTFLIGQDEPETQYVPRVPVTFLDFLGVQPILGRGFVAADATDPATVTLISYGSWKERFGGDPNVLGSEIRTERATLNVVGVMPRDFSFQPVGDTPVDLWIPNEPGADPGSYRLARLNPGVTVEAAAVELRGIVDALTVEYPGSSFLPAPRQIRVSRLLDATIGADWDLVLMLFLGAVGFVLVIAVANTANLTFVRGLGREQEIAIRSAVGSTRGRLVRQLLVESVLLSLLGGLLGIAIAFWTLGAIVQALPPEFPRVQELGIDGAALGFTLATVLVAGIAFGIGPALSFSSPELDQLLREGGRGTTDSGWRRRFRSALVAGEVALATILVTGGLLLAQSFVRLMGTPIGIDVENVISATLTASSARYDAPPERQIFGEVAEVLRRRPDVVEAARSNFQGIGNPGTRALGIGEEETAAVLAGGPEVFEVLGIAITSGRVFRDGEEAAVVVTEGLVDRYFSGADPVGRSIGPEGEFTIVGVARDFRLSGPAEEPAPLIISPVGYTRSLLVKVRGDPRAVMNAITSEIRAKDPDLVLTQTTFRDSLHQLDAVSNPRFRTAILGAFAAVALLLALVGISGVTAYSASRRRREIGIRIALGGTRGGIRRMMLREAMTPVIIGLGIGIIGAAVLTRLLAGYLYEVSPAHPLPFTAASLVLLLTATVATWIALSRSTAIDPMEALRHE